MRFNYPADMSPMEMEEPGAESAPEIKRCTRARGQGTMSRRQGLQGRGAPSDDVSAALNAALRLLTRREYSLWELKRKLAERYTPEAVEAAAARCVEEGWQSEARTAEMLLRHMLFEGYGPRKLYLEMQKRRLDRALLATLDKPDWEGCATDALRRRYGSKAERLQDRAERQKALAFLYRRGFGSEQCLSALKTLLEEVGGDPEGSESDDAGAPWGVG